MFYKLDKNELEDLKLAEEYTNTDYEIEGDFIPVESMMCCISDLIYHIKYLEEDDD
jgi:hypothetical protein